MTDQPQGRFGPRPLAMMLRQAMQPALRKRTYTEATLILDWEKIISIEFARRCAPKKLTFPRGKREGGILLITVDSGSSLLVQHSIPLLIDWINAYFGYRAIEKIRLVHDTLKGKSKIKGVKDKILSLEEKISSPEFESIKDLDLKTALNHFKSSYLKRCKEP